MGILILPLYLYFGTIKDLSSTALPRATSPVFALSESKIIFCEALANFIVQYSTLPRRSNPDRSSQDARTAGDQYPERREPHRNNDLQYIAVNIRRIPSQISL